MSTPYLGEIRLFSFANAPNGWAQCKGALLPLNQNQALFSLLGTTYGGDGRTTFALPDLQGRTPTGVGGGYALGTKTGTETVTLNLNQMAAHNHPMLGIDSPGGAPQPNSHAYAQEPAGDVNPRYASPTAATPVALDSSTVQPIGGGQAHPNMQPYLVGNYCIALQGVFPSRG